MRFEYQGFTVEWGRFFPCWKIVGYHLAGTTRFPKANACKFIYIGWLIIDVWAFNQEWHKELYG